MCNIPNSSFLPQSKDEQWVYILTHAVTLIRHLSSAILESKKAHGCTADLCRRTNPPLAGPWPAAAVGHWPMGPCLSVRGILPYRPVTRRPSTPASSSWMVSIRERLYPSGFPGIRARRPWSCCCLRGKKAGKLVACRMRSESRTISCRSRSGRQGCVRRLGIRISRSGFAARPRLPQAIESRQPGGPGKADVRLRCKALQGPRHGSCQKPARTVAGQDLTNFFWSASGIPPAAKLLTHKTRRMC